MSGWGLGYRFSLVGALSMHASCLLHLQAHGEVTINLDVPTHHVVRWHVIGRLITGAHVYTCPEPLTLNLNLPHRRQTQTQGIYAPKGGGTEELSLQLLRALLTHTQEAWA